MRDGDLQRGRGRPKSALTRKARTLLTISPDEPNFDALMLSMMKRERMRRRRREAAQATSAKSR